ncbi:helix-turn-helix domain-containing protein [Prosthecomicrobium sp. N25]|uniref:helix-turn-helix domain-containing protein n=1 Tax=Prosthecomicrobium sp. N25 TaxID=3129254 RepID=UPI003076E28A
MNERVRLDLDIRLLRTLHLLLTESSVSRVARILGQTQPAVSASLKRLRETFGDPLLVRSVAVMTPISGRAFPR